MLRSPLAALTVALALNASAQTNVAHVNTGLVLEALPASGVADSLLRQFQDSLAMGFRSLEEQFVRRMQVAQNPDSIANMTQRQQQALQVELQSLQEQAGTYQELSAQQFERRRVQYLQPLVDKVSAAIEAYAKTNDINLVLDTSVGGVLVFADETKDITEAVRDLVLKTE